jgi:hypothetical protein
MVAVIMKLAMKINNITESTTSMTCDKKEDDNDKDNYGGGKGDNDGNSNKVPTKTRFRYTRYC